MPGDGLVAVRDLDQGQGEFDAGDLFECAGLGGVETGFSLAGADVDEMFEGDLRFLRLLENDFQVAAGDGLIIGGVFEIGLDRTLQDLLVDDGLEAQAVELLEKEIFKARPVARAIVEDGEIEDAQGPVFLHGPSPERRTFAKR